LSANFFDVLNVKDRKIFIYFVNDHPLNLVCPGLLVAVGETSYGIWMGLIGSTHSLHCLFMCLFAFEAQRLALFS
jgi:hypothetical protein